jgi:hypothetical protein
VVHRQDKLVRNASTNEISCDLRRKISHKINGMLLLPIMKNVYVAIQVAILYNQTKVSTTHSMTFLSTSYPPSASVVMTCGCGVGDVELHG